MNPSSHSIYNVNPRKVSDRDALEPGTDEPILPNAMWLEAQTRLRRQTYLFVFTVLLSAVALTSLTTYHYMTVMRGRRTEPRSATPAREQGPSPLGFDASPETLFLYEELSKPSDLPDKGDLPLTVASVRSVAYYLVKAERAQQQQRFAEAQEAYQQALRLFPDLRGAQVRLGMLSLRQRQYEEAAAAFERAGKEEPMTFSLANNLGVAYLGAENFELAEEAFRQALRLNPDYAMAYYNMATLHLRRGNLLKATPFFEQYMERRPGDLKAAQTYALVLLQLEQWDAAAALLQRISREAPDVAPIQFRLAQALSQTSNRPAALQALRRAAALTDPRQALVWLARTEYDTLREEPEFKELIEELGARE